MQSLGSTNSVAGFVQVKNEDFWIELILRVICKVFPEVLVMDNGSQDRTLEILRKLQEEGITFHLRQYNVPWRSTSGELDVHSAANAEKNIAIQEYLCSRWIYVVDGDEIQFEASCKTVAESVADGPHWRRGMTHFQFNKPNEFMRITRLRCASVRHRGGRLFDFVRTRWKEPGYDEFEPRPESATPGDSIYSEASSHFLPGAVVIHAAHCIRSSRANWKGANDAAFRANYSSIQEEDYEPLVYFPKEALECRFSDHNPFLSQVLESKAIKFV